jgi:4-amino-4-deoxy-L-arabinose transferase-like glycosyltransferase
VDQLAHITIFIIVMICLSGFGFIIWSKEGIHNIAIKFLLGVLCVFGIYILVNDIPQLSSILVEMSK